jgi:nitrate/nitrite-specific signal transduction histidine kinase
MIAKVRPGLAAGVLLLGLAGFTAGCSDSKADSCQDFNNNVHKSVQQMTADQADPKAFTASAQKVVQQLRTQAGDASDPKVRAAVTNFANDLDAFVAGFRKLQNGDPDAQSAIAAVAPKIQADAQALDTVCK